MGHGPSTQQVGVQWSNDNYSAGGGGVGDRPVHPAVGVQWSNDNDSANVLAPHKAIRCAPGNKSYLLLIHLHSSQTTLERPLIVATGGPLSLIHGRTIGC